MDKNFKFNEAPAKEPVIFDHIFAEKVGGGLVKNAAYDRHPGLAVSADGTCLKGARLVEAITAESTSIKVAKDSGFAVGEFVGSGVGESGVAVAITAIDSSHDDYDILTATLGVALGKGAVVYQAKAASAAASGDDPAVLAEPKLTPIYVLGTFLPANCGDELAKLVNGANVRKETALFPAEIAALMKGIHLQ